MPHGAPGRLSERAAARDRVGAAGDRTACACCREVHRGASPVFAPGPAARSGGGIIGPLAPRTPKGLTPLQLARLLRGAAVDKKAWDTVVIAVREQTSIADYFVICEGETDRQVRAIADAMVDAAKDKQLRPMAVDGYEDATWILRGFDSVLAHVFLPGERSYYDLESLWAPAAALPPRH